MHLFPIRRLLYFIMTFSRDSYFTASVIFTTSYMWQPTPITRMIRRTSFVSVLYGFAFLLVFFTFFSCKQYIAVTAYESSLTVDILVPFRQLSSVLLELQPRKSGGNHLATSFRNSMSSPELFLVGQTWTGVVWLYKEGCVCTNSSSFSCSPSSNRKIDISKYFLHSEIISSVLIFPFQQLFFCLHYLFYFSHRPMLVHTENIHASS